MEEIDDLIVTPFKEIADKARQAVENAGDDHPDMLKVAKSLLKEAERGLKRIEPLCKKHIEDYGSSFTTALKENGSSRAHVAESRCLANGTQMRSPTTEAS